MWARQDLNLQPTDYESDPVRFADLGKRAEDALDLAFRVFTTCRYLALVFTESRPERVLEMDSLQN